MDRFGVKARVGIGENKVLAKLACDNFAKKAVKGFIGLEKTALILICGACRLKNCLALAEK